MKHKFAQILALSVVAAALFVSSCSTATDGRIEAAETRIEAERPETAEIAAGLLAVEKAPNEALTYVQLALAYIKHARATGDASLNAKAAAAVKKGFEASPDDLFLKKIEATLQLSTHRFADALVAGKALVGKYPQDSYGYGIIADAYIELGDYEAAVRAAQRMVDLKPNAVSYARVGQLRSLHGDMAGAIEMYTTAARTADPLDKEFQSYCLVRLASEHLKYGKYAQAEKILDEALVNFPGYHMALSAKASARAAQKDLDAAIAILTEATNRVANVENVILLGDLYAKRGELNKAEEQYARAENIELSAGDIYDQQGLALLWSDRDKNLDQALEIVERDAAFRSDIFTLEALARTLLKKGRLVEAKAAIEKANRLNSKDCHILYYAGIIESSLGNKKRAAQYFNEALQISPEFDVMAADDARARLASL